MRSLQACMGRAIPLMVVLVTALVASACSPAPVGVGDKTGDDPRPVTLRLATPDDPGTPGHDIVDRVVQAVHDLSHGAVTISVTKTGHDLLGWDQVTIGSLTDGDFDLALIPARAWRSKGVTTLDALQLPTLVQTDEQADAVSQSGVAPQLTAGLDQLGVTGLGIYPEALRHIAVWDQPDGIGAEGLIGKTVRAPRADLPWATITALGGTPIDINGSVALADGVRTGKIQAAETSLSLATSLPGDSTMTVDVSLYYKFQVLAARTAVLASLDPPVRTLLTQAAQNALSTTITDRQQETDAVKDVCTSGTEGVTRTPPDVRARIESVLNQTVKEASRDANTLALIEAVREAAGEAVLPPLTSCDTTPTVDPRSVKPLGGDVPDGTYRIVVTDAMLRDHGMPERDVSNNSGIYTLTLNGGRFTWSMTTDLVQQGASSGSGIYEAHGHDLVWLWGPEMDGYALNLRWSVRRDRALLFTPGPHLPADDYSFMRLGPMIRIR